MPAEVVFRVKDSDGRIRLYVAYLFRDPSGRCFAVLSEDEDGYGLESSAKLDPSLLVEQRDNVSDAPLLGVVDAPRLTSQMQQGR